MNRSLNICNYKTLAALLLLLLPLMSVPLFAQHYAIDNVSMQPNPFSPNGDGIRDELTISFYLNNSGPVNISVEQVTPMSVLYSTTIDGHSGLNHFTWDGKDGLGTVLPDGKYALRIEFYTASYYLDDGIIINTTPPEIEMISSSPNPFSPNGDGYQDVHTVKYRVKNSNVQYLGLIKVDFAAKTAKFVDDINGNTGPFDIPYSDGMYLMINRPLAYFGNITAPSTVNYTLTIGGSYSFPVSISRGQDLYKIGQNYMPYRIVSPSIGLDVPDEFNIGEDYLALYGIEGNATFNIHNNDGSDRSLNDLYPIYFGSFNDNFADPTNIDISNGNIYSIAIGSQAGTIPGDELDDGRYIYRIKVTNAVEYATEENGELLVNSHPITVESYIAPNRISPENQDGLFDQAIIHYEPSEDGYITIKIHDQDNNLIRTLVNEQLTFDEQGGYVLWDGKDDGGNFVSSGATNIYIVEITVRDRYIPSDVASLRQSIVVDNALPTSPVLHQLFPDQLSGKEVIISGITNETNCDVILFLNGVNRGVAGKTGASPGYFEFNVTLEEGDNSIYIKLKDEVANLGTPSNAITLFLDSQPPQITILTPQENATFNTKDIDVTAKVADNGSGVDLVRFGFTIDEEESIKWINGTFLSDDTYGATYTVPASINEQKITMVVEATDMLENKTTTPTPRHFSYKLPTSIAPPLFVGSIPESNANIRVIPNNRVEVVIDSEVDLINDPAKSTIILYHPSGQGITHGLGGNITYHKEGSDIHTIRLSFTQPLESSGEDDGEYRLVYFAENILNQSITDEIFFKYDTIKPYVDNYRLNTTEELLVIDNQYFFNKPIDSISVDVNDLLSGVDFATNLTRVVLYDSNNEVVQGTGSVSANTVSWTLKNTLNPSVTHQTYRIYVRATDKAGNQLVVNRNFVLLKTIQPSITSTYPAEDSFNNTLNNNSVTVRVTDNNHFGIDSSKTTIELKGAGINYSPTNNATLSVQNISANTYDISLALDSSLVLDGSFDDTYEVSIKVTDLTGEEITKVYEFDFDSQMPTMSSPTVYNTDGWDSALTPNLRISNPIDHFSIEVSDNLSGVNLTSPNTYLRLHKGDTSIVPGTFEIVGNTLYWRLTNRLPNDGTADGSYYLSYSVVDKAGNLLRDRIIFQVLNPLSPIVDNMSPTAGSTITSLTPNIISLDFTDERGIDLEDYSKTYLRLTTPQNSVISHNNGATLTIIKNTDTAYKIELALDEELAVEGIYRVDYRIENNQGYSDSGVWSFTLDNAAPIITNIVANLANGTEQPLSDGTIIYRPITSIRATVSDKTSKLDLDPSKTFIKVTNQSGSEVIGVLNYNESTNTLLLTFDSVLEELDMRYDVVVKAIDVLGNSEEETFSFNLKSMKTEIVEVYPASNSNINTNISYVYVKMSFEDVVNLDNNKTKLRLKTPSGDYIEHNIGAKQSVSKSGNTYEVRLTLNQPLSTNGDDDGKYQTDLVVSTDLFEEGPFTSEFTYDKVAPYYTNIAINPINSVLTSIFDHSVQSIQADYFDLTSGVNFAPNLTKLTLLDANSNVIPGRREVDGNTIKWILNDPIEELVANNGTYYINLQITDLAGNVRNEKVSYEMAVDTRPELVSFSPIENSGYVNNLTPPIFEATFTSIYPLVTNPNYSYINIVHPNGSIISDNNGGKIRYTSQQNTYVMAFELAAPLSDTGEDDGAYTIEVRAQNVKEETFETSFIIVYDTQLPYYDNLQVMHTDGPTDISGDSYPIYKDITAVKVRYVDLLAGMYVSPSITNISLYDPADNILGGILSFEKEGDNVYATWTLNEGSVIKADGTQDGKYKVKLRATDKAGNQFIQTVSIEVITVTSPSDILTSLDPMYNAHLSWSFNSTSSGQNSYFEIFRKVDVQDWKLIATTKDSYYTDSLFNEKDGRYQYKVRTVFVNPSSGENTYSEAVISDQVDLKRFYQVTFNLLMQDESSPKDALLHIISNDGLYNQEHSKVSNSSGKIVIDDVFAETYLLTISKLGYDTIVDTLTIDASNTEFTYTLGESSTLFSYTSEKNDLFQNFPNPFNPTTEIRFALKENSKVSLKVYNTKGQQVITLVDNETLGEGYHRVRWDGTNKNNSTVPSGIYFYQINISSSTGVYQKKMKMLLLK